MALVIIALMLSLSMRAQYYFDSEGERVYHACYNTWSEEDLAFLGADKGWEELLPRYPEEGVICLAGYEQRVGYHVEVDGYPMHFIITSKEAKEVELVNYLVLFADIVAYAYSGVLIVPEEVEINGEIYKVVSIGSGCGDNRLSLKSIRLPDTIEILESYAITSECRISISLGNGLRYIQPHGIYDCNIDTPLTLPASLREIREYGVANCQLLPSIEIQEGVRKFGKGVLSGCSRLEELRLPSTLELMQSDCVSHCENLKKVVIPRWCTMEKGCFNECPQINEIYCYSKAPMSFEEGDLDSTGDDSLPALFNKVDFSQCILYVPHNRKQYYEQAKGWRLFKNIVEMQNDDTPNSDSQVSDISMDKTSESKRYYLYDGVEVAKPENIKCGVPYIEVDSYGAKPMIRTQ